jgi:hypothetical protein
MVLSPRFRPWERVPSLRMRPGGTPDGIVVSCPNIASDAFDAQIKITRF